MRLIDMRRVVLPFVLLLAACSSGGRHDSSPGPTTTTTATSASTTDTLPPAPRLAARLVLSAQTVRAGSSIPARVVVVNNTGRALHATGCQQLFQIALANDRARQEPNELACLQRFTIPVGESSYRVPVEASYSACVNGPEHGNLKSCLANGRIPPLPPGVYTATLFDPAHVVPAPASVAVRVTAP